MRGTAAPGGDLGVLAADRVRSILVVSDDGELAVALHDAVDRSLAVVRDARPDDCVSVAAACLPWPWLVAGCVAELHGELRALVSSHPVQVMWLGAAPAGLPAHASTHERVGSLIERVRVALDARVAGMHLAPGCGVQAGGVLVRSGALEALVAAYPSGFAVSSRAFRPATAALHRLGVPWRPHRGADGLVRLCPVGRRA